MRGGDLGARCTYRRPIFVRVRCEEALVVRMDPHP